jgi:hypothetical protein
MPLRTKVVLSIPLIGFISAVGGYLVTRWTLYLLLIPIWIAMGISFWFMMRGRQD